MQPELIKQLKVLDDVCSMFCEDCNTWRYHYYIEKRDITTHSTTVYKKAVCVRCETLTWEDTEIIMRKR